MQPTKTHQFYLDYQQIRKLKETESLLCNTLSDDSTNPVKQETSVIENETVKLEDEEDLSEKTFKMLCLFEVNNDGMFKCKLRHREGFRSSKKFCYNLKNDFNGIIDSHLRKFHNTSTSQLTLLSEYMDGPVKIPLTVLVILLFFVFF